MRHAEFRHIIYALIDPRSGYVGYIGRSSSRLNRAHSHWENPNALNRHDPCHRWLKSIIDHGLVPIAEILEEFPPTDDVSQKLNDAERFWIASFRASGARLKNITDGGDSFPDTRGPKNWMYGRAHPSKGKRLNLTDEQRDRRRVNLGKPMSTKAREKLLGKKGEEHPCFGRKHKAETIEKMRKKRIEYWAAKRCG